MPHGKSPRHARRPRTTDAAAPASDGRMRVQKILAAAGIASRRAAEELIRQGRVTVDGRRIGIGDSADPRREAVALDGERIRLDAPRYWVLHKPRGVVTTLVDPFGRSTVRDLIPAEAGRVFPVGRLDRDSSGLLLLTNDGALTERLLHPSRESEKEYRVTVKGELGERARLRLERGITLEDGRTKPTRVKGVRFDPRDETTQFELVLTEGRKHQIRRMLLVLGHPVKRLVRVRVGPLELGRLAPGAARPLTPREIRALLDYAAKLDTAPRRRRPPKRPLTPSRPGTAAARRRPAGSRA